MLRLRFCFLVLVILINPSLSRASMDLMPQVCYHNRCLNLELALNQEQWRVGLMAHEVLAHDTGMLFVFPNNDYHAFWMKNMHFALDLIWIDDNGIIVDVKLNQPPCHPDEPCPSIKPKAIARYVLEINAGEAKRLKWIKGRQLLFKHVSTTDIKNIPEHAP